MLSNSIQPPDANQYNADPVYLRSLIERAGLSQRAAAKRIGVGERAMRSYLSDRSNVTAQPAPYPVQYALEMLAFIAPRD